MIVAPHRGRAAGRALLAAVLLLLTCGTVAAETAAAALARSCTLADRHTLLPALQEAIRGARELLAPDAAIGGDSEAGLRARAALGDRAAQLRLQSVLAERRRLASRRSLVCRAQAGDAEAAVELAATYYDADSIGRTAEGRYVDSDSLAERASEADRRRARALLEAAADANAEAALKLARMVEAGFGGPRDAATARCLYARASTRLATWYLAAMTERGDGAAPDPAEARRLYKSSADQGQIDARYDLARMTRLGLGGPGDPAEARRLLVEVVAFCHGDGASDLAEMAEAGEGGARDVALAAAQYRRAVDCHNEFFRPPLLAAAPHRIAGDVRRAIQRQLRAEGRYQGPIDGRIGTTTRRALDL